MKTFFALIYLSVASPGFAALTYNITINKEGYNLTMDMSFKKGQDLQSIRSALKNGDVLALLSPNIVSVINTPKSDGKYQSLMHVKSFGIHSFLSSICEDKNSDSSWSRSCSLQTRELDGGKYMQWKGDEVECQEKDREVNCHFLIKGQTKPVKFLGLQIVSPELFSVKAKLQALSNFFKLYLYMNDFNLSPKLALESFAQSSLKTELEFFEKEATKAVKTSGQYQHSFSLKDQE